MQSDQRALLEVTQSSKEFDAIKHDQQNNGADNTKGNRKVMQSNCR